MARALAAAGERDFLLLEAAAGAGGTWRHNTYPGVACDAPSHLYSFAGRPGSWSRRFAPGAEILAYLEECAEELDAHGQVRYGARVEQASWNGRGWELGLADGSRVESQLLVLATGQLDRPAVPDLPGLDSFPGPVVHTARWRHDLELDGLRVGVLGTGASAVQVVPALAGRARHLTVFQRSAGYVFPKPDTVYGPFVQWLHRHVPPSTMLPRLAISSLFNVFSRGFWQAPRLLRPMERAHARALARAVPDPAVRDALTPRDRAGCKRMLVSSDFHPAFARSDVTLDASGVLAIEGSTVRTAAGAHELDVLVLATGFDTRLSRPAVDAVGRDGRRLSEQWARGASAYLGMSVPGFPNLFLGYGPNTNLGSGSIVQMLEAAATHVVAACDLLDRHPGSALEVREEVYDGHVAWLRRRQRRTVWMSGCASWYLDESGLDTHNWPATPAAYRRQARRVDLSTYRLT